LLLLLLLYVCDSLLIVLNFKETGHILALLKMFTFIMKVVEG